MVWKPLSRLQRHFQPFFVVDASCIDDRPGTARNADLLLRDLQRDVCAQALRIEAVVNAEQFLSRNPQLEIFSPGVLGVSDAAQKAWMAENPADPRTQGWNLVRPRPVVIEHDPLPEQQ